jgi:acetylornithine deacetylase/succinyl-diaminopimelate desuccinylase-like protein
VMLGPGEIDQFHSEEEHVQISDLLDMARVYHALITRMFE